MIIFSCVSEIGELDVEDDDKSTDEFSDQPVQTFVIVIIECFWLIIYFSEDLSTERCMNDVELIDDDDRNDLPSPYVPLEQDLEN